MQNAPLNSSDLRRLIIIAFGIFALFVLLILQFFKLQVIEGEKWTKTAAKQHQMLVREPHRRGVFYSNTSLKSGHPETKQPFVIDVPIFHLYCDPEALPENLKDSIERNLSAHLELTGKERQKLKENLAKKCHSRRVERYVDPEIKQQIENWWMLFAKNHKLARNALYFVPDFKRCYPFGSMLGQVLHTIREEEGKILPTGGLELIFQDKLKGKEGKRLLFRSPRHPMDYGKLIDTPEDGADIYLTINHHIQAIAEQEIEKAVKAAGAKGGWAIMMEPNTGEILAWAQYPFFNPAKYRYYFNDKKLLEETKVKGLTNAYEPGSIMKPLMTALYLQASNELVRQGKAPLFDPKEKIDTSLGIVPGRVHKPIKDLRFHQALNMYMAIQKSSNVYMAKIMQRLMDRMGPDWLRKNLKEVFGFGVKTGIELPGESAGLMPTPGKKHPNGTLEWSASTPYILAMGHNILVNSMQMLKAFGIIANGGFEVKPSLVRKIVRENRDGSSEVLQDNSLKITANKRVLDEDVTVEVVKAMRFATKWGGTSARGDIPEYSEGLKSGTAEKIVAGVYSKKDHISYVVGFAPAILPQFVLLVAIDEPEFRFIPGVGKNQMGGTCAAPAFKAIGLKTLQYLGVEPDEAKNAPSTKYWDQQVRSLRELYQKWND